MGISWTLIVLGTLLQGMQCNANDDSTIASKGTTVPTSTTADSTKPTTSSASLESTKLTTTLASSESTKPTTTLASSGSTKLATTLASSESTKLATTLASSETTKPGTTSSSPDSTTQAAPTTTKATSPEPTRPSPTVAKQNPANPSQNVLVTTQITTVQPKIPNAGTTAYNSPQNLPTTVIPTSPNQVNTILNKSAAPISTDGTTQLLSTQTNPSDVTKNPTLPSTAASDSKSTASQSLGTTKAQTTTASIVPGQQISTSTPQNSFSNFFDLSSSTKDHLHQACKTLGQKMKGNCSVIVKISDKQLIATVIINADQNISLENYEPLAPVSGVTDNTTLLKGDVNKDTIPDTLIAILASCGALVLILCCFAAYCTHHRRSYRKNQQHLTEELQTVENGYHDNPTLEVMEVQPEMQEKKLTKNREFNDSWIVPIDNLLKEDIIDEEDTHL